MRKIPTIIAVLLTIAMAASPQATGEEGQSNNAGNKSGGSDRLDHQVQIETRFITIKATESRRFEIDWVALGDGQTTVFADASKGVGQEDQDRVDLTSSRLSTRLWASGTQGTMSLRGHASVRPIFSTASSLLRWMAT